MKEHNLVRWKAEIAKCCGNFRKPQDLIRRRAIDEDFLDCAVIAGFEIKEIIAGHVAEAQIPGEVLDAFHRQFPNVHDSFVEMVSRLKDDPDALQGLLNGVKGKLFEINYVEWLNDHLPDGFHAALAESANNPGWDISITDPHGHISELLQAKATSHIGYIREALEAHPDIDIVATSEVFDHLSDDPDLAHHVIDSGQNLSDLDDHVGDAIEHAEDADIAFHFPFVAVAVAIGHSYARYRLGYDSASVAIRKGAERGALAVAASAVGWASATLASAPVAVPAAVATRYYGRRVIANFDMRKSLDNSISNVAQSIEKLEMQLERPIMRVLLPAREAGSSRSQ